MVEFGRIYININKYIYIYIYQYFISFYMPIYRIFPILLDYQRLRPVDADQAPREAHQLSVEENSLSSDWSTWKGQGAPAVEPMIDSPAKHGVGPGCVNIEATVLKPSFHIISSSQIRICDVYIYICIYLLIRWATVATE